MTPLLQFNPWEEFHILRFKNLLDVPENLPQVTCACATISITLRFMYLHVTVPLALQYQDCLSVIQFRVESLNIKVVGSNVVLHHPDDTPICEGRLLLVIIISGADLER